MEYSLSVLLLVLKTALLSFTEVALSKFSVHLSIFIHVETGSNKRPPLRRFAPFLHHAQMDVEYLHWQGSWTSCQVCLDQKA